MEAGSRRSVIAALAAEQRMQGEQDAATAADRPAPAELSPADLQQPQVAASYWPPAPPTRAKPRKIMLIPVLGVLVIVFGVVTGLAIWREANPPQVENPVTVSTDANGNSTKHYSNSDFSYSFNYPSSWVLQEDPTSDATAHSVVVFDPEGEQIDEMSLDSATIGGFAFAFSGRSLTEAFADLKDGFTQGATESSLTIDEPFTETSVGGLPAIKATCSATETDGTKVIVSIYYVVAGGLVYYVELDHTARPTDTSKAKLDAILASFKPAP
jgi:hypothetical protein